MNQIEIVRKVSNRWKNILGTWTFQKILTWGVFSANSWIRWQNLFWYVGFKTFWRRIHTQFIFMYIMTAVYWMKLQLESYLKNGYFGLFNKKMSMAGSNQKITFWMIVKIAKHFASLKWSFQDSVMELTLNSTAVSYGW